MFLIHDDKKKRWGNPPDGTSEKAVPEIHDSLKAEDEAPLDENITDLVRQAQNGDDDAFSELVRHYEKFVYNTACKALSAGGRSIDGADDIAQSAFIKAWRNLSLFRGECTVSLVKDTEDEDDGSEWDVPVTSGDTIPEDAMERKEAILAVRRAIEELPEDQRQVIVMRDLHELSYQEIADKLGIELGTVRSRINRGRQKLKNILENGNFFGFPSSKG